MNILDAQFIASATKIEELPAPFCAEIAFAGRSNVGKSSLINSLLSRKKLVRTSSTPGCTRAINLFRIELSQDARLDFIDLPGYGYAQRSKKERKQWGELIESFLSGRAGLHACIVIVDIRRGLEEDDQLLLQYLKELSIAPILVATKLDKLPKSKQKLALTKLQQESKERVLGYSAIDHTGREELWKRILKVANIAL